MIDESLERESLPGGRSNRDHLARLELSRSRLLRAIGDPEDLTLIRPRGNIGDRLIQAGTRRLLAAVSCGEYREIDVGRARESRGHTALLGGSGGWCAPFHGLPGQLAAIEERFERVIVLPSSFDTSVPEVTRSLERSSATLFAREEASYRMIRSLCRAELAHDCAFFFDFAPYRRDGSGVLTAFRTDEESAHRSVPMGNRDISVLCGDLDEWLWTIARHTVVRTDRAHVTIAGALLGKRVEYLASSYHKVPAIVDWSLREFPVERLPDGWMESEDDKGSRLTDAERLRRLEAHIRASVPDGRSYLLVDDAELGPVDIGARIRLPFLERNGVWWGPPADDEVAIYELERMRAGGAAFAVFAWPSFWWLDHYAGFRRYLDRTCACRVRDEVAVLFDLRADSQGG